jgi:hypothetical protein
MRKHTSGLFVVTYLQCDLLWNKMFISGINKHQDTECTQNLKEILWNMQTILHSFFMHDKNFIGLASLSLSYLGSKWIIFEPSFIYLYLGTLASVFFRFSSFQYSKYIDYALIQSCLLFPAAFATVLANLSFFQRRRCTPSWRILYFLWRLLGAVSYMARDNKLIGELWIKEYLEGSGGSLIVAFCR